MSILRLTAAALLAAAPVMAQEAAAPAEPQPGPRFQPLDSTTAGGAKSGAQAKPATPGAPGAPVIVNYWQLVRDVMRRIDAMPPRKNSIGRGLDTPGQEYPFEAFRHLRMSDLLRAARESVDATRRENAERPEAEVFRKVRENISLCLEYAPLLARESSEAINLSLVAADRNEPVELRRFLLERMQPGQAEVTLLGMYLEESFDRFSDDFYKNVRAAAAFPGETPEIQIMAIRVLYDRTWRKYENTFRADPVVAEKEKSEGKPLSPALLLAEPPLEIGRDTRGALEDQGALFADIAAAIIPHIEPDSIRDESVKEETRAILRRMLDNVLLPDRNRLLKALDPSLVIEEPKTMAGFELPPGFQAVSPAPAGDSVPPPPGGTDTETETETDATPEIKIGPDGMPVMAQ